MCTYVADAVEINMIFECPSLHALRQQYAPLFCVNTPLCDPFLHINLGQEHMQRFDFILSCLDVL